jgi:hypothetical protein
MSGMDKDICIVPEFFFTEIEQFWNNKTLIYNIKSFILHLNLYTFIICTSTVFFPAVIQGWASWGYFSSSWAARRGKGMLGENLHYISGPPGVYLYGVIYFIREGGGGRKVEEIQ